MQKTPIRSVSLARIPLQLLNLFVLAVSATWFARIVGTLPAEVPVHWGPSGPDRYGSPHELWVFLGVMVFDTVLMWGLFELVAHFGEKVPEGVPAEQRDAARTQNRDVARLVARLTEGLFVGMNVLMAGLWYAAVDSGLTGSMSLMNLAIVVTLLFTVFAVTVPLVLMYKSAKRARALCDAGTPPPSPYLGIIYFDPNDERLWVEKRFGVGWTPNFAHPKAWWVMGVALGLPLLLTVGLIVAVVLRM